MVFRRGFKQITVAVTQTRSKDTPVVLRSFLKFQADSPQASSISAGSPTNADHADCKPFRPQTMQTVQTVQTEYFFLTLNT